MQNIELKLQHAFGKKTDLDSRLQSASSGVLTQKIDFQESSKPHSSVNDLLKGKYVNLAPPAAVVQKGPSGFNTTNNDGEGLPLPKHIAFTEPLDHAMRYPIGAGLVNVGNTCFLNATLQCVIHTPPLANYMISGHHSSVCRVINREKCILCNLQALTKRSVHAVTESLNPKWFINNLQYIGRHFRSGRQEDAHEFLRLSLEKMQRCALIGQDHLDKYSKETTVINQIFGGYLRSQVLCCRCGHKSNTYDPLLDISLDIKTSKNIVKAFEQFVEADKLEFENAYKCERCKQKVTAYKRFTIHRAPSVLTIQLKRFQFGSTGSFFSSGTKVHKPVRYPLRLDIRPFMSQKRGTPVMYRLFGSIQHEGMSSNSGHYVANIRSGDQWYNFNDSCRRKRSLEQCLNEQSAYILFYQREVAPTPKFGPSEKVQNGHHAMSGMKKHKPRTDGMGSPPAVSTFPNGVGPHQKTTKPISAGSQPRVIDQPIKSPLIPLPSNRDKIRLSFGVKTKPSEKSVITAPPKPVAQVKTASPVKSEMPTQTGRLVMKIKDGRSVTIETSPDGERKILSDDEVIAKMNEKRHKKYSKKPKIVPYADDSDSDWSSKCSSPTQNTSNTVKDGNAENGHLKNGLVFDGSLNTTTSVPGNAHLFNTVTLKDKVSHTSQHQVDRPKDLKMFSMKNSQASPLKRQFSETLSCVTSPVPAKYSGNGEWHTRVESMLSPSVGSNHSHSSTHSNGSTHDWSVLKNKDKPHVSSGFQERKPEGWTVTPGRRDGADGTVSKDSACDNSSTGVNDASSPFEDTSYNALKPKKPKDKNSEEYKLYKKLKKHKKHKKKHHEREHNYSESVKRSHKKSKRKHRDREVKREIDEGSQKHVDRNGEGTQRHIDRNEEGTRIHKDRNDEGEQQHIDRNGEGVHRHKDRNDEGTRIHKDRNDEGEQQHIDRNGEGVHKHKYRNDEGAHRHKDRNDEGEQQHIDRNGEGVHKHKDRNDEGVHKHKDRNDEGEQQHIDRNGEGAHKHKDRNDEGEQQHIDRNGEGVHKHKDRNDEGVHKHKDRNDEGEQQHIDRNGEGVHKHKDRNDEGEQQHIDRNGEGVHKHKDRNDEGVHKHKDRNDEGEQQHIDRNGEGVHKHKDRNDEGEQQHIDRNGEGVHKHKDRNDEGAHRHKDRNDEWTQDRNDEGAQRLIDRNGEGAHKHKDRNDEAAYRHKDGHDEGHHKRQLAREVNEGSKSSTEFEWVEKRIPSVSAPGTPCHRWDYHIKDGYKRTSSSGTSTPTVASWDGLKASKIVHELEKVSSFGYGAPVSGWDGSRSHMDLERHRDYIGSKRRDSDDEYDDEYDRGKVKKVKYKHENEHRINGNVFQQKQDQTNRSKINWSALKIGDNNPFSRQSQPNRPHPSVHTRF